MELTSQIEARPGVRCGKPCFIGTRITVYDVLDYLASGMTNSEIISDFPELTEQHIRTAIQFAATRERRPRLSRVKLLFDQNISHRLVGRLAAEFPHSSHVVHLGLDISTDREIWDYAGKHGFTIVPKDTDFRQLAFLKGPPPKANLDTAGQHIHTRHMRCSTRPSRHHHQIRRIRRGCTADPTLSLTIRPQFPNRILFPQPDPLQSNPKNPQQTRSPLPTVWHIPTCEATVDRLKKPLILLPSFDSFSCHRCENAFTSGAAGCLRESFNTTVEFIIVDVGVSPGYLM